MNCGPKNGNNRYTRPVLTQMAQRAGIENSVIRKADIHELCKLLNLPAIAPGVPVTPGGPVPMICGPTHGKNRYTRPVLEQMARDAGITNAVIRKASLPNLCDLLNLHPAGVPVAVPSHDGVIPLNCGPTHGKNRYTRPVLEQMARDAGITNSVIRKADLPELCRLLKLSAPVGVSPRELNKLLFVRDIVDRIASVIIDPKGRPLLSVDNNNERSIWWNRQDRTIIEDSLMRFVIARPARPPRWVEDHNYGFNFNYIDLHDDTINGGRMGPIYIYTSNTNHYDPSDREPPFRNLIVEVNDAFLAKLLPDGSYKYLTVIIQLMNKGDKVSHAKVSTVIPQVKIPVGQSCIARSKLNPKDYQIKVINHLDRNRGILVVHGLGSGKTLTSVIASQCYLDNNPRKNVYVITPKTLTDNWKNELLAGYKNVKNMDRYHFYTIPGFSNVKIDCRNSMLIIDEAHTLRTQIGKKKGKRAEAVVGCAKRCDKVILLTGTPYVNEPNDLNNLISIIDGKTPDNKKTFNGLYKNNDFFRQTFRNKISLYNPPGEIIAAHYPRVEKHEIVLPMTKKILKQYMEIEDKLPGLNDEVKSMAFFSGVRIASNKADSKKLMNTLKNLCKISQKIEWINRFIDSNMIGNKNENNKMVIFSSFIDSGMTLVEKLLEFKQQKYSFINGECKKDNRAIVVKDYNKNKSRYLLISRAAGEGIDLKNTTFMIILDPAWNSVTTSQAMGRVARFNSHAGNPNKKVDIYMLYLLKPKEKLTHVKDINSFMDEYVLEHSTVEVPEPVPSIDLYLRAMSISKQNDIDEFIRRVTPMTIENI
jgi:superfamily II DNA or RNA helicase